MSFPMAAFVIRNHIKFWVSVDFNYNFCYDTYDYDDNTEKYRDENSQKDGEKETLF